jgi:hypothetical protein
MGRASQFAIVRILSITVLWNQKNKNKMFEWTEIFFEKRSRTFGRVMLPLLIPGYPFSLDNDFFHAL